MNSACRVLLFLSILATFPPQASSQVVPSGDLAPLLANQEILRVREKIWSGFFGLTYEEGSSSMLLTAINPDESSWEVNLVTSRLDGTQASGLFVESSRWDVPKNPVIVGNLVGDLSIPQQFITAGLLTNPATGSSVYLFGELFRLNHGSFSASFEEGLVVFLPLGVTLDEESAMTGAARTALERQPSQPAPAIADCDDPCLQQCYGEQIRNGGACIVNYYDCANAAAWSLLACSAACTVGAAAGPVAGPIVIAICVAACVAVQQNSLNLCRSNQNLCSTNARYSYQLCTRLCAQAPV